MVDPLAQIQQNRYNRGRRSALTMMPRVGAPPAPRRTPIPIPQGGDAYDRLLALGAARQQQQQDDSSGVGGVMGSLGKVVGKPLSQFFDAVDTPRAGVNALLTEGLGELIPALFPNEPTGLDTDFSWQDIWENTKNNTGFGTSIVEPIMGEEGTDRPLWMRRLAGFAGDLATDPLSYVNFGAGQISGKVGRADELFKLQQAQRAAREAGDAALVAKLGDAEDLAKLGRRGTQTANKAQREAMGLRAPGAYWGQGENAIRIPGTRLPGEVVNQTVGRLRGIPRAIPGADKLRKAASPLGALKQDLNPYYEVVLGRGKLPASTRTDMPDIERALHALDINQEMRLGGGGFKGKATTELKRLANRLRRERRIKGATAAITKAGEEGADPDNVMVDFGRRMREIAASEGIELPGLGDGAYAGPHVLDRGFRDFLDNNNSPAAEGFRRVTGITNKDLLEEGGFLQRRTFRVVDGEPTSYYFGPENLRGDARKAYTIELKTGSVDELNDELHRIFPNYQGKIYETDPFTAWERYIGAVGRDVSLRRAGRRGLATGAPGFRQLPEMPEGYDPVQWERDIGDNIVGASLPERGAKPPAIDEALKYVPDTAATKERDKLIRSELPDIVTDERAAADAERRAAAEELGYATEAVYEPIRAARAGAREEVSEAGKQAKQYQRWIDQSEGELADLKSQIAYSRKEIRRLTAKQKRVAAKGSDEAKARISTEMAAIRKTYDDALAQRDRLIEARRKWLDGSSQLKIDAENNARRELEQTIINARASIGINPGATRGELNRWRRELVEMADNGTIDEYFDLRQERTYKGIQADRLAEESQSLIERVRTLEEDPLSGVYVDPYKRASMVTTSADESVIPKRWRRQPDGSYSSGESSLAVTRINPKIRTKKDRQGLWWIGKEGKEWVLQDPNGRELGRYRTLADAKQAAIEPGEEWARSKGPGGLRELRSIGREQEDLTESIVDLREQASLKWDVAQRMQAQADEADKALKAEKFGKLEDLVRKVEINSKKANEFDQKSGSARTRIREASDKLSPPPAELTPPPATFTDDEAAALEVARKALTHPQAVEVVQRQNRLKQGGALTANDLSQARIDRKWIDDNPVIVRRVKAAQAKLAENPADEAAAKVLNGPKARDYIERTERLAHFDTRKAAYSRGAADDKAWLDAHPDEVARVKRIQDRVDELTAKRDAVPKSTEAKPIAPPDTPIDEWLRRSMTDVEQTQAGIEAMPERRAEIMFEEAGKARTKNAALQTQVDAELADIGMHSEAATQVSETIARHNDLYKQAVENQAEARKTLTEFDARLDETVGRKMAFRRPALSDKAPSRSGLKGVLSGDESALEVQPLSSALGDLRKLIDANPDGADPLLNRLEAVMVSGIESQRQVLDEQLPKIEQGLRAATAHDLSALQAEQVVQAAKKGKLQPVLKAEIDNAFRLLWEGGDILVDRELRSMYENVVEMVETKGFWRYIETFTNLFKTYATGTPGFHVRNALSAMFMNGTEGVPLTTQLKAGKLWKQYLSAPNPTEWLAGRSKQERDAFAAVFASGTGGQFTERGVGEVVGGQNAALARAFDNPWTRLNRRWGTGVEGTVRLGLALDSTVARGMDTRAALNRISRVHFDYSQVSGLDETMKRLIPFWTFMSRNIPLQVTQMAKQPKWYSRLNRLQENRPADESTPEYIRQMGAIDTGIDVPSWLPGAGEGDPILFSPDLGHLRLGEDFARIAGALTGESGAQALSDFNPAFTVPAEYMMGQDFFTGQRYEPWERKEKLWAAARGLNPVLDKGVRLNPWSENNDPDKVFEAWIKTLAGAPIRTVTEKQRQSEQRSQAYQQREAMRRAAYARAG